MRSSLTRLALISLTFAAPLLAQAPAPAPPPGPAAGQGGRPGLPPGGGAGGFGGPQAAPPGPGRSNNPFTTPIVTTEGVIAVKYAEFATIPDAGGQPARMNLLLDEPATKRLFVNTMTGMLYTVSYDGKSVAPYLDINDAKWTTPVQAGNTEQGFQSFAFHPAVRADRRTRLRQVLYVGRHEQHDADRRFHAD